MVTPLVSRTRVGTTNSAEGVDEPQHAGLLWVSASSYLPVKTFSEQWLLRVDLPISHLNLHLQRMEFWQTVPD